MKTRYKLHWASGRGPSPELKWEIWDWTIRAPIAHLQSRAIARNMCALLNTKAGDTAYMPVPRCETCKHWKPEPDRHYKDSSGNDLRVGECTAKDGPWSDCNDYTILTDAAFGCVQWAKI